MLRIRILKADTLEFAGKCTREEGATKKRAPEICIVVSLESLSKY